MKTCPKTRLLNANGDPFCSDCGQFRPLKEFRMKRNRSGNEYPETFCRVHANARRAARARELAAKERAERPARLKRIFRTPKPFLLPPPVLINSPVVNPAQVNLSNRPTPKLVVYPMVDPETCIYPGAMVWISSGKALIADLFSANVGMAIVRGWASTISDSDEGLVTPRFERPQTAKLFNSMMAYRTGRWEESA
jgi:hypothetical protein